MPVAERFWSHVDRRGGSECWPWFGATQKFGYGSFSVDGKRVSAHRFSFKLHNEENIDQRVVRHTCHNPRCVNPAHLISGTVLDNVMDCLAAGRRNETRKVTPEIAALIRVATGTDKEIGDRFGLSASRAGDYRRGVKGHLHVPGPARLRDFDFVAVETETPNSCKGCLLEFSTLRECKNSGRIARDRGERNCDDVTQAGNTYIFVPKQHAKDTEINVGPFPSVELGNGPDQKIPRGTILTKTNVSTRVES